MSFSTSQFTKASRLLTDLPEVFEVYPAKGKRGKFLIVMFKKSNQLKNFYSFEQVKNFVDLCK